VQTTYNVGGKLIQWGLLSAEGTAGRDLVKKIGGDYNYAGGRDPEKVFSSTEKRKVNSRIKNVGDSA